MEYVVGPVIALLLGMKFTAYTAKKAETDLASRVVAIETVVANLEKEMPRKLMVTMAPVTAAVKKLNEQVGI